MDEQREQLRTATEDAAKSGVTIAELQRALAETQGQLQALTEKASTENAAESLAELQRALAETQGRLQATTEDAVTAHEIAEELRESLGASETSVSVLTEEIQDWRERTKWERDAMELERYRAMESLREKWEAREQRAVDRLEALNRNLGGPRGVEYTSLSQQLETAQERLQSLGEELLSREVIIQVLREESEAGGLERDELRAELTLMHAQVRRLGMRTGVNRGSGLLPVPPPSVGIGDPRARSVVTTSAMEGAEASGSVAISSPTLPTPVVSPSLTSVVPTFPAPVPPTCVAPIVSTLPAPIPLTSVVPTVLTLPAPTPSTLVAPTALTLSASTPSTLVAPTASTLPAPTPLTPVVPTVSTLPALVVATQPTVLPRAVPSCGTTAFLTGSAHLLPQIPNFYGGDQKDGETFEDWVEHFESVAGLAGWDDHFRLVHLASSLRGAANSFYRSCPPTQRSNYRQLIVVLRKRFTPVQLTAVQTQLFHSRRQGQKETVDDFVQELRKLHTKAYSPATRLNPEAEKVGQIVLVNQFISGLRTELQSKVVGVEGSMDELVLKARFEEAKIIELTSRRTPVPFQKKQPESVSGGPMMSTLRNQPRVPAAGLSSPAGNRAGVAPSRNGNSSNRKCFNCELEGHMARACPYPKQSQVGQEAHGRRRMGNVTLSGPAGKMEGKPQKERN